MEVPPVLAIGALVFLLTIPFGLAIGWETWKIHQERRRVRRLLRDHENASKARKAGALAEGMIWDRELDG